MNRKRALRRILPFCSLYSLVLIRYLYYGFTYFYQLDDYIQYFDLSFFSDNLWQTMITLGSFQRPAAGFSDLYIWSFFFPVMILAVALIAALYTATALLLRSVFCRFFRVGWLFPVLFALSYAFCEKILYLSVHRPKIVLGPCCNGGIQLC